MFKPFSGTVSALYERASHAEPCAFPAEALQLACGLIACDGALLNMDGRKWAAGGSVFSARHDGNAPVTAFRFGPGGPLAWDTDGCAQAGMRRLLVHGDAATPHEGGRWIVLYRMDERGFDEHDAELLHALWPHIRQALAFNRERSLRRTALQAGSRKKAAAGKHLEKRWAIPQFLRAGMLGLTAKDMRCG